MTELVVVAVITAKTGSEHVVRNVLTELVTPTREETGCMSYDLYESTSVGGTFVTVERWREQSDLDAHLQTEHIAHALAATDEHLAAPPAIHPLAPLVVG